MQPNTVVFTAEDGKRVALPLEELLQRGAIIATKVNGADIKKSFGSGNQLMVPGLPAKYFVRNIVDITFCHETNPPKFPSFEDDGRDFTNRPNISMSAPFCVRVGEVLTLHGWANDFDKTIVAVEISLDEGETWHICPTAEACAEKLLWWNFDFVPHVAGTYCAWARAVNEEGKKSPTPAIHSFEVTA